MKLALLALKQLLLNREMREKTFTSFLIIGIVVISSVFLIMLGMSSVISTVLTSAPLATDDHIKIYENAINEIEQNTRTLVDGVPVEEKGVILNIDKLLIIDLVRYEQNFDKTNFNKVHNLGMTFIESWEEEKERHVSATCTDEETGELYDCSYTVIEIWTYFRERPFEEVINDLKLSKNDKNYVLSLYESTGSVIYNPEDYQIEIIGSNGWAWPVNSTRITSPFGSRTIPKKEFHTGIDIGAVNPGIAGDSVWSMSSGKVIRANRYGGYGNCIIIDHGEGILSFYAHLFTIAVKKGQNIETGELIGTMGNTGKSYGVHLHFEIRSNNKVVDPLFYFSNVN
jgi:hypothetical protein